MTIPKVIRTIAELRHEIKDYKRTAGNEESTVGFVPTMGYLHAGHASLLRASANQNGLTVLSIFVNPLQFGPKEDLDQYPRDEGRDLGVAAEAGADLVFIPTVREMYPELNLTTVKVEGITELLCGASRPGHFDGVATVVTKLFNIVQPDRAYFGMKDAQQLAVITRMVKDLNMAVEIIPCDILRDADGLALSSRNVYLSQVEREQALVLSRSIAKATQWIREGLSASQLVKRLSEEIRKESLADIDYVDILSYPDLIPLNDDIPIQQLEFSLLIALAVRFGKTRLIDNKILIPQKAGER